MNLNWLSICAEGQTRRLHRAHPGRLPRRVGHRRRSARHHRSPIARFHDVRPEPDGGRHRDQHRGRLDHLRPAPADLPRFDRDRARRRTGRTVGRRPDRHPVQPHLVDPADPGRRQPDGRLLRPGGGRHRPDGRLLGEPGRVPVPIRRRARRRLPVARRRVRGRLHRAPGRAGHDRPGHRPGRPQLAEPVRRHRHRDRPRRRRRRVAHGPDGVRPQGRRSAHPHVPHRRDRDLGVRPDRRAVPAAVRPDRLLLGGQRQGPRRRWAARPVVRWRGPELPRDRRPGRAHRRGRAGPRRSGSWPTRGPARASMPGCSRYGSAERRRASSRR